MHWDVHYTEETGSTNADLLALAWEGAPAGAVLRARHQTAGRGRLGRTWSTPPGGALLASVLLRPAAGPSFWDTAAVAVAAGRACRTVCCLQPLLKWPNDLLVGDRKLAGVLAEADAGTGAVVIGIGLNLLPPDPSQPTGELAGRAIALSDLLRSPPAADELLDALLVELAALLEAGSPAVREQWSAMSATIGQPVRVELAGLEVTGTAERIDADGALVVDGRPVHAGDVVHLHRC